MARKKHSRKVSKAAPEENVEAIQPQEPSETPSAQRQQVDNGHVNDVEERKKIEEPQPEPVQAEESAKPSENDAEQAEDPESPNKENSPPPGEPQVEEKPQPKYDYKDGNWSPLNPSGVKSYDRDLLLQLKKSSLSNRRPENLPDLDVVKMDAQQSRVLDKNTMAKMHNSMGPDFTPMFIRGNNFRDRGLGQQMRASNSMQGMRNKKQQKVIEAKPSALKTNLKTIENAWVPISKTSQQTMDDAKKVRNTVTGMLNKVSPENYNKLKQPFKDLIISNEVHCSLIISIVYDKAISEQHFSSTYAKLCKSVTENVKTNDKDDPIPKMVNKFKRDLLVKCQTEFEKIHHFGGYEAGCAESMKKIEACTDDAEKQLLQGAHDDKYVYKLEVQRLEMVKKIDECTDENQKKELVADLDFHEGRMRKRSTGLVKFVGELYLESLLTPKIMIRLIDMFGRQVEKIHTLPKKDAAEGLCKLFTVIGARLYKSSDEHARRLMKETIERCRRAAHILGTDDNRIKFMLLDIIELFDNNFVAKHQSQVQAGPSTKEEVYNKMIEEQHTESVALANSTRQNENRRGAHRGSMNRDVNNTENSDVWNNVVYGKNSGRKSSLKNIGRHNDNGGETRLGPASGFSNWSHGASGGIKEQNKPAEKTSNRYNLLEDDDMSTTDYGRRGGNRFAPIRTNPFQKNQDKDNNSGLNNRDHRGADRSNSMGRRSNNLAQMSDARNKSLSRDVPAARGGLNARRPVAPPAPAAASDRFEELSEQDTEKLQLKINGTIAEFCNIKDLTNAQLDIQEKFKKPVELSGFVMAIFTSAMEKKDKDRESLSELFSDILAKKTVPLPAIEKAFIDFVLMLDDLSIDVPRALDYFVEILLKGVIDENMTLKNFWQSTKGCAAADRGKVVLKLMEKMKQKKGEVFLLRMWEDSGLTPDSFTKFFESRRMSVNEGFEDFAFLTNPENLEAREFHSSVIKKLDLSETKIVKETVRNLTVPSIKPNAEGKIEMSESAYETLAVKFEALKAVMENSGVESPETELQIVYTMQSIAVDHSVPSGLLSKLFSLIYETFVVSKETFEKWENTPETEEQQYHGSCVTQVRNFLRELKSSAD